MKQDDVKKYFEQKRFEQFEKVKYELKLTILSEDDKPMLQATKKGRTEFQNLKKYLDPSDSPTP